MGKPRSAWISAVDLVLIVVAATMVAALGSRVLGVLFETGAWWLLPFALVLGVLAADFATGTAHWFCDSFFAEDTPVLGAMMIRPFREHHVDPQAIVRHHWLELHGNSCIPVIALLALAHFLPWEADGAGWIFAHVWLFFFTLTSLGTNQFHMWAHAETASRGVRWLQRRGLILAPERHARHHRADFSQSYCMTTGWMNPLLDRLDFFPRLERGIRALRRLAW